ncbi:MAG: hypothetical protein ACRD0L_15510 [Acidimicrobiales bacterium]
MEDVGTLAAMVRPVAMSASRTVGLAGALAGLFPEGGLQRGSTVVVRAGGGGVSLALALAAAASSGGWVAAAGLPSLGLVAAAEMGARLERLALVPAPGERWPVVAAALLDGVDLLLLGVAGGALGRVRAGDARRLGARARERGAVLMVLEAPGPGWGEWPEPGDVRLRVAGGEWNGLGVGHGRLRSRRVEVAVTGRRAAARERRFALLLPGQEGEPVAVAEPPQVDLPAQVLAG